MDLTKHIPQNNDWIDPTIEKLGWEYMKDYGDRVYKLLLSIAPGKFFDISKSVAAENHELFIRLICLFTTEKGNPFKDISFNKTATIINRKKDPYYFKKSNFYTK